MAYNFERFANNSEFVFYSKSSRKLLNDLKNDVLDLCSGNTF